MRNKQIESLRRRMGWSQAELAQRLHISPSTVGMYEQGRRVPSLETLLAMSAEFGVTLDYLVTGKMCPLGDLRLRNQTGHIRDALAPLKSLSREDLMTMITTMLMKP